MIQTVDPDDADDFVQIESDDSRLKLPNKEQNWRFKPSNKESF